METEHTLPSRRYLIVNADDFGQSPGTTRGVIRAHERGIVTSASLMVRWPATQAAAKYAREHRSLSVGLHIDLGEWAYRGDKWVALYQLVDEDDAAAVQREATRQLADFRRLVGRDPTHLDSHQHAHSEEPVRSVLKGIAEGLGVPLRGSHPSISYSGAFYGQAEDGSPFLEPISVPGITRILEQLPAGVTELGCHPADEADLDTMYLAERERELQVLCDPRVRTTIAELDIELRSFASLPSTR
jgi:chitin disaccharide deacetylase